MYSRNDTVWHFPEFWKVGTVLEVCHSDKVSERINLKEEAFISVHSFRSNSSWLVGYTVSRPMVRHSIVVERQAEVKLLTS